MVHLELSIAADFTAQPLEPLLTWWLERLGVRPRFALAQYDQVEQTLLAERNVFRSSDAGWNLILLRRSRCALERLDGLAQAFHAAARGSERNWGIVVLDDLVDGDSTAQRSPTVWHVAQQLVDRLADIPNVHVWSSRDIDRIYPTDTVVDPIAAQAGDIPFSMEYHWAIATFLTRQLHARLRRPYKVIATDCDNTLWGGVVGEVGPGQLEFSARHLAWQRALVQCAESGMLVCLCSQNNPGDVWQVFEQCPEMLLQRKHLVASQINWLPKPEKLCRLAEELGVGLDSFLFVDDSPLEIAQVRAQLPMVTSVPFPVAGGGNPGSSESPPVTVWLRHLWPLDRHAVTNADQQRTDSMRREATRRRYRKQFSTLREFWQSLDLCVEFADLDSQNVERAAQLCQRTNQMNMSLRRHSAGQLSDLAVRPSWQAWTVVARDRFGDYGQTGLMVVEYASDHARVDTFLLSCRALGRTVEFQMLRELGRRALQHGRDTVRIDVVAGPRNQPARAVVEFLAGRAVTGEGWVDIAAHRLAQLDPMEAAESCARAAEVSSPSDASADEHPAPAAPASSGTSSLPQSSSPAAGQGPVEYADLRWIERIPGAFHSVARIQQEWNGSAPAVQRRHGQYSPPRTNLERVLVDACEQVVHLKQVGVEDAFRDLGLTSIQLVLLHSRVCNALHADLPITDFFAASTLRQLAQVIERSASQPGSHAADQPGPLAEPVAIVGMAGRFPGAEDVDAFWRNLAAGIESIVDLADDQLNLPADSPWHRRPDLVRRSAHLDQADAFDAAFFGIFPREAQLMDPQHRVLLECGWHALEDAGYCPDDVAGLVGVFAGCYMNTYALASLATRPELLRRLGDSFFGGELPAELGFDKDYLATRLAFFLNLKGPAVTVQTACSTSLVAIIQACQALQNRQCDMALAGGVTIRFPQRRGYVYTEGSIVSPDGHCRAFDADARGTVFGDGAGMVVLKRLEDARRDGDHIYAVVRGWGINNDGHRKVSYPAPSPDGQAAAIVAALQSAGLSAESISYIEAHGTGTSLGDPIEVSALTAAFRRWTSRTGFCGIGSVKTNIGHLDVAAGVTGVIKVCQALRHEMLPATLHFRRPNPNIDFGRTPFYVVAESQPWPRSQRQEGGDASTAAVPPGAQPLSDAALRRAGVSSYGVGGTNAHVILEEPPPAAPHQSSQRRELLVWSAQCENGLQQLSMRLAERLAELADSGEATLADVAGTLQTGRKHHSHRRFLVASSLPEAAERLREQSIASAPVSHSGGRRPRVAFLFPGQGAQHPAMARRLYESAPVFRREMDRCNDVLRGVAELDLLDMLWGPSPACADALNQTAVAQPGIFSIGYALAQWWLHLGVEPVALLGHSVGEFVAATLAGVFSLEDALALIAFRGKAMQELPRGCMLAVRLPESHLRSLLPGEVEVAAVNGPELCVASGPEQQIAELEQCLAARDVVARRLHTSHAFHSAAMEPVVEPLRARIQQLQLNPPCMHIASTASGDMLTAEQAVDPAYWARHLRVTVRFTDALTRLIDQGVDVLLEVGPGQTTTTLARQHPQADDVGMILASLPHAKQSADDYQHLLGTLGKLWSQGVAVDWQRWRDHATRRVPLPGYPFQRKRFWFDQLSFDSPAELPERPDDAEASTDTATNPPGVAQVEPALESSRVEPPADDPALAHIVQQQLGLFRQQLELWNDKQDP